LDISMPGLNGIEAARRLKQTNPGAKLIILTMHGELSFVRAAFKAGVSGYLLKHSAPTELVTALHDVDHGDRYISSLIPNRLGTRIPGFRRRSKKLSEDDSPAIADPPKYSKRGRKSMGAEERMQVSERMTRYWAGRRRQ